MSGPSRDVTATRATRSDLQGGQDSNLQPAVLETAALPIEPPPFGVDTPPALSARARSTDAEEGARRASEIPTRTSVATAPRAEPPRRAGGRGGRRDPRAGRARHPDRSQLWLDRRARPPAASPPASHPSPSPRPSRSTRKAKALQAAGRPVISYAAGEPDFATPDAHRRGGRRRGARPAQPPLHPRRRPARPARGDRREDPARLRPRGVAVAGHRHQRRQAGRLPGVRRRCSTTGDEVLVPDPLLDHLPRGDPPRGRRARRRLRGRRPGLPRHRRAARGRAHRAHQGAAVRLALEPDRRGVLARADPRDRRVGRLEHGLWVISDEIYQNLIYDGVEGASRSSRPCRRWPTARSSSTASRRRTP